MLLSELQVYPPDDHLRVGARVLTGSQNSSRVVSDLPSAPVATHAEVLLFVDGHAWYGIGLSLVDAHLLAAARLSSADRLWTRDRRLRLAADSSESPPTYPRERPRDFDAAFGGHSTSD